MLGSIFKTLSKMISHCRDSVSESTEVIDDILEKEYIYNGVKDIKEATGKVVQESGRLYQQSFDKISETARELNLNTLMGESFKITHRVREKTIKVGNHAKDRLTDKDAIYDSWSEAIEISKNLNEIKDDLLDDIKNNLKNKK